MASGTYVWWMNFLRIMKEGSGAGGRERGWVGTGDIFSSLTAIGVDPIWEVVGVGLAQLRNKHNASGMGASIQFF
jgi:hypothetical protein